MKGFYTRSRFETEAQDHSRDIVSRQGKVNRGKWLSNLAEIFVVCFLLVILGGLTQHNTSQNTKIAMFAHATSQ